MANTFGNIFRITTFGESHGKAIGVVVDGCPAGLKISEVFIQSELDRRKPGQSKLTSQRKESDIVQVLSGVFDGKATGAPIAMLISNSDARPEDYAHLKDAFRPSHADFTYEAKYGHRDHRGGGRSSARETATRVAAGAVAKMLIAKKKIVITAWVSSVGSEEMEMPKAWPGYSEIESNAVRCPDRKSAMRMIELIESFRKRGDTLGGVISCVITGVPVGLGEPVYNKLSAALGSAMLSINAVKGFEIGSGFKGVGLPGSVQNDLFIKKGKRTGTVTNHSGGIQGGISNGEDIFFRVAFKPVATLMQDQQSIDKDGREVVLGGKGRHDPCVVPRAVPIVEAMAALVMADFYLLSKTNKL